ncbi:hypothetical protein M433DRAFT_155063, partial [Acidomyces richmondensis BFW]
MGLAGSHGVEGKWGRGCPLSVCLSVCLSNDLSVLCASLLSCLSPCLYVCAYACLSRYTYVSTLVSPPISSH